MCTRLLFALGALLASATARENAQPMPKADFQVSGPDAQPDGVLVCRVTSPYQRGETLVRVLLPKELDPPEKRRILLLLPVEAGTGTRWGDPLRAAKAAGLAERLGFVTLLPTFSDVPWYCDHPSEPTLRQESYVLKVLVPLAERLYPHDAKRRAVLGYSKSGWGAFSLLLRHPEAFAAACAWDAPMAMAKPAFEMPKIVGTQENFERYRIERLLREHAEAVRASASSARPEPAEGRGATRLGLFGYSNFRKDTQAAHALMTELGIPHAYADGPRRKHHWESGWLADAAKALRDMLP